MEAMAKQRSAIGAFCCAMLLAGSTWAATLEPGQGSLSINQGQGFEPVNSRIDAKVGDSVMVGPGGSATLVYDDGCTVDVQPGSVTTIAPLSPCASGSNAAITDFGPIVFGTVAVGVGAGAGYLASQSSSLTAASP